MLGGSAYEIEACLPKKRLAWWIAYKKYYLFIDQLGSKNYLQMGYNIFQLHLTIAFLWLKRKIRL